MPSEYARILLFETVVPSFYAKVKHPKVIIGVAFSSSSLQVTILTNIICVYYCANMKNVGYQKI